MPSASTGMACVLPICTNDIFYNWIDKDRVHIPHADIQMRLFARTITDLLADTLPLPRL